MKPKLFKPEITDETTPYVKDQTTGLIWHRTSHRTLYADTDRSQVVYHGNYLRYFEFGRASLMRAAGYPYKQVEADGFIYPIIAIGLDYHQPLRYDDPIWVNTRPGAMERVRLAFDYVITHRESGAIICKGFTRHCATNAKGVPVGIDASTKHLWQNFPT